MYFSNSKSVQYRQVVSIQFVSLITVAIVIKFVHWLVQKVYSSVSNNCVSCRVSIFENDMKICVLARELEKCYWQAPRRTNHYLKNKQNDSNSMTYRFRQNLLNLVLTEWLHEIVRKVYSALKWSQKIWARVEGFDIQQQHLRYDTTMVIASVFLILSCNNTV